MCGDPCNIINFTNRPNDINSTMTSFDLTKIYKLKPTMTRISYHCRDSTKYLQEYLIIVGLQLKIKLIVENFN